MTSLPQRVIEAAMIVVGAAGLLILIAPNFGRKPKATPDGWQFRVKPTCLLLYVFGFILGAGGVAFASRQLLCLAAPSWPYWVCFGFGAVLTLLVLADWPAPLVLDRQGLVERGSTASLIRWDELKDICEYRMRYDRGVVIHGSGGKQIVVAEMAYDCRALLDRLLERRAVPLRSLEDESAPISIFRGAPPQP